MKRILSYTVGYVVWALLSPETVLAQTPTAPQPSSISQSAPIEKLLKNEELDALAAPIALYPDNLLSLVLMASTYPLEVVQADRFVKENGKLKADALKAAVDKQSWDDAVKSLVATPDVLGMMSSKIDWMKKLGDAVLAQQPDLMDAIQRLRNKADANNKLPSTKEQKVVKRQDGGKQIIAIESATSETIYVPYYDPAVVYGAWPYTEYPPYYFGWPGYIPGALIGAGLAFGAGWALGHWGSGGNFWGGDFNWNNNNININRPRVNPLAGNNWQHNPAHRHGVRYDNPRVQQHFGNNNRQGGVQDRMDFRGRDGSQVIKPDGGRAGAGQLPASGDRPGAGQRPDGKGAAKGPSTGQRPAGKNAAQRPSGAGNKKAAQRPSGGPGTRGPANAMGNIGSGRAANFSGARGHASLGGGGPGGFSGGGRGGGGFSGGGRGGGGFSGGGGRGGGGRRSDINLKHDIVFLGQMQNGIGFYRFSYNGEQRAYVGVIAQEVQSVMPSAVIRDRDGYLRVLYEKLGLHFQTYERWLASGGKVPIVSY